MEGIKEYYLVEHQGVKYLVVVNSTKEKSDLQLMVNGNEVDHKIIEGLGATTLEGNGITVDASLTAYSAKFKLNKDGQSVELNRIKADQINSTNATQSVVDTSASSASGMSNNKWRMILGAIMLVGTLLMYIFDDSKILGIVSMLATGAAAYYLIGTFFPAFMSTRVGGWVKLIGAFALVILLSSLIDRVKHGGVSSSDIKASLNENSPSIITTISKVEYKTKTRRRRPDVHYYEHSYNYSIQGKLYSGDFRGESQLLNEGDTIKIFYHEKYPNIHKVEGLISSSDNSD